ncbi:MAG: flagellar protein FlgN [Peptococcaceae bacterium]|nr:flagellar protein FlgN [Peptococcaceae bacterium]
MSSTNWDNLVGILEQLHTELVAMLVLGKRKQQVLIDGNVDELNNIVNEEETLIAEVGKLERLRTEQFGNLAKGLNLSEHATIKEIADFFPPPLNTVIQEQGVRLTDLTVQLKRVNADNISLIKQAMDIIQFTLESVVGYERQPAYGTSDKPTKPRRTLLIDHKI